MPGEIAEMMLDGVMCESCGEFFEDGNVPGHPRKCAGCLGTRDLDAPQRPLAPPVARSVRKRAAGGRS